MEMPKTGTEEHRRCRPAVVDESPGAQERRWKGEGQAPKRRCRPAEHRTGRVRTMAWAKPARAPSRDRVEGAC